MCAAWVACREPTRTAGWALLADGKADGLVYHKPTSNKAAASVVPAFAYSEDQQRALDRIAFWLKVEQTVSPVLTMGGYAGTGKTTVVAEIARLLGSRDVAFCAYAGKAAAVLRAKLLAAGCVAPYCGTIHGLIYMPTIDQSTGQVTGWRRAPKGALEGYRLIVVDEASMVDAEMWRDLLSFGRPVLAVGDHGQLPPFKGVSLIENPDVRLERVHRQAADNPLLQVATAIREGRSWQSLGGGPVDIRDGYYDMDEIASAVRDTSALALCRYNQTRVDINEEVRRHKGLPEMGDPMVILRNQRVGVHRVYNGERGVWLTTHREEDEKLVAALGMEGGTILVSRFSRHQFGRAKTFADFEDARGAGHTFVTRWNDLGVLADYAHAMTVHKAQGSEWPSVVVVEQKHRGAPDAVHRRWLYTAVTRASERLVVFPA